MLSSGEFLLAGTFSSTVNFGLMGASDPRTSAAMEDAFLMQIGP
jgi:hypothetical protein